MVDDIKAAFAAHRADRHLVFEDAVRAELAARHDDALTVGHIVALVAAMDAGEAAHWKQFDQEVEI